MDIPKAADHKPFNPRRRSLLQFFGAGSVAGLPVAHLLGSTPAFAGQTIADKQGARSSQFLVRDFIDTHMELVRLLKEVTEIEHSLMLQYLYAAFSLKPQYKNIAGYGVPTSNDLLGVAIQEMQHLGSVNRLLVALGASPNLDAQDFPYEPDIYPCEMNLESLSRESLAKYVFAEAPEQAMDISKVKTRQDKAFVNSVCSKIGEDIRINHVGSVYQIVLSLLEQLHRENPDLLPDYEEWVEKLTDIMVQGEVDHFNFFKSLYLGKHTSFDKHRDIWSLPQDHEDYPSYDLIRNPSAYRGHPNQIQGEDALALAWLSNLHYWFALTVLDYFYRYDKQAAQGIALACMTGPIRSIGQGLAKYQTGLPFDRLSMGYRPGVNQTAHLQFAASLIQEAGHVADNIEANLPGDYPQGFEKQVLGMLSHLS